MDSLRHSLISRHAPCALLITNPSGQEQAEDDVLPAGDVWFVGQRTHAEAADALEYDPSGHLEHLVAAEKLEKLPSGQAKHVSALLAPGLVEYLPGAHPVQADDEVAALDAEYFPASHRVHASVPLKSLKDPGAHAEQLGSG